MWAFGNHLLVKSVERRLKTCDFGVAAIFHRPYQSRLTYQNAMMADIEYVRNLQEIVELKYKGHCVIVLFCKFVKANYCTQLAMVKNDRWRFTLANFIRHKHYNYKSFDFPLHIE